MRQLDDADSLGMPYTFAVDAVIARRLAEEDWAEMYAMHRDPDVMSTLGGVRDRAATDLYLAANLAHWERYGFGIYRLSDRRNGSLIGRAGLRHVTIEGTDEVEVAYALRSPYWGRGLAVTLTGELLEQARACRLSPSIVAFTLVTNLRSQRVMQKAGFVFEREFEHTNGPHVLYRRLLEL